VQRNSIADRRPVDYSTSTVHVEAVLAVDLSLRRLGLCNCSRAHRHRCEVCVCVCVPAASASEAGGAVKAIPCVCCVWELGLH